MTEESAFPALVADGYPAGAAVSEPQRSGGPVDEEHPVLAAGEDEVGHRGPLVVLAVPLPERQRRVQQASLGVRQVQVLAGERQPSADLSRPGRPRRCG